MAHRSQKYIHRNGCTKQCRCSSLARFTLNLSKLWQYFYFFAVLCYVSWWNPPLYPGSGTVLGSVVAYRVREEVMFPLLSLLFKCGHSRCQERGVLGASLLFKDLWQTAHGENLHFEDWKSIGVITVAMSPYKGQDIIVKLSQMS